MALPRCYNFEAFDMATKFAWVNDQPGMAAAQQSSEGLQTLTGSLESTRKATDQGTERLGISWQGPAADAAQESLTATATGVSDTATVAQNGADRMIDHGHSFEAMRRQLAYVDPSDYSWVQRVGDNMSEAWHSALGSGEDHVTIGERNAVNEEVANRALRQYESETSDTDDRFTTATAPASDPAGPPPGQAGGGGGGGGVTGGGGGGGGIGPAGPPPGNPGNPSGTAPAPAPNPMPAESSAATPTPAPHQRNGAESGSGPRPDGHDGTTAARPGDPSDSRLVDPQTESRVTSAGQGDAPPAGGQDQYRPSGGAGGHTVPDRTPPPQAERPGYLPYPTVPGPAADRARDVLARKFGEDHRQHQLLRPPSVAPPAGGRGAGGGTASGTGAWGTETRTPGTRGALAEVYPGRVGEGTGRTATTPGGYGPMMGGAGGVRDGQDHRNRYVVPTDEVFDVEVTATDAVLGPEEDHR